MDLGRTLPADVEDDLLDELVASKRLIETLAHLSAEGVLQVDDDRRVVRFNAAAERMLGYSSMHLIGTDARALLHPSNAIDPFVPELNGSRSLEIVFADSAGAPVTTRARSAALERDRRAEGWMLAFSAAPRLDEIEQLKSELVSTVSHELKTPLAAIKAYTATLRQNPALYEARRDEFLGVVEQQADRLSRLVDDMLLVTRVGSAQLLRRRVRLPLERIVRDALAEIAVDRSRHPIICDLAGVEVSCDPERLHNVMRNLIENAVKYSPNGGDITISGRERDGFTEIFVEDNGVGIESEHLPYIYDRFYRADDPSAQTCTGGSGLGLYIVNAIVRAHGGTVSAHSVAGKGTTFTVRLPLR